MIGIYGANGFVGRHLITRLAESRNPARAVSRRFDPTFIATFPDVIEFMEADLRQPIEMASSLQGISTVIQLISTSSPGLGNEHLLADIKENVIPHVEFLASCVNHGVNRFIFLSSGGTVYGPQAQQPTPESFTGNPICSHGLTKLILEKYIQMHGHVDGLEYLILRLTNPFGPGQEFRKGQGLIPAILNQWQKGLPIRIFGNGQAKRDYLYIEDAIDAIESSLTQKGAPQCIFNIGSGETRSILEVIDAIEAIVGDTLKRDFVEARSTDVDIVNLDISKAKNLLNWNPKTAFYVGLQKTVQSFVERESRHRSGSKEQRAQ